MRVEKFQRRVLVVDDDPTIRLVLDSALTLEGYDVRTAQDGAEALTTIQHAAQRGETIGAIVLDAQMPVLTGIEFVRAYHRLACCHAPVLLFTADPTAEESAAALRIDAVLSKPADLETLLALLDALAAAPPAPPAPLRTNGRYHPRWVGELPLRWCVWDTRDSRATEYAPVASRQVARDMALALDQRLTARDQRAWLDHEVRDPK